MAFRPHLISLTRNSNVQRCLNYQNFTLLKFVRVLCVFHRYWSKRCFCVPHGKKTIWRNIACYVLRGFIVVNWLIVAAHIRKYLPCTLKSSNLFNVSLSSVFSKKVIDFLTNKTNNKQITALFTIEV